MSREIFGSLEEVELPQFGVTLLAKIDTGAWSGALHCTDIYEKDGKLYFTPIGDPAYATSVTEFEQRRARSASGHVSERFIVPVKIVIKGKVYDTTIGITDRSDMQREMLLGRKFLIENDILVDVALTLDDDHEAERFL